jgi:trans-2,3-dihydro-3-hydroxyanthranilate isomerase
MDGEGVSRRDLVKVLAAGAAAGGLQAQARAAKSYAFTQWDVFTRTPLTGNPLLVFGDARGLSDDAMQALARESNLSETTFILPRDANVRA